MTHLAACGDADPASLKDWLLEAGRRLRNGGIADPRHEARLLAETAWGLSLETQLLQSRHIIKPEALTIGDNLLTRRLAGEPIGRLRGWREFWGLRLTLSPDTLEPRPDSETLIMATLEHLPDHAVKLSLLDLGTGSGCLLLALATELPHASGLGLDIAAGAVITAAANAATLGLSARLSFARSDWDEILPADQRFDVILSNPPYIPAGDIAGLMPEVRQHDPLRALDGGDDGLEAYRQLAKLLPHRLAPQGFAVLELGVGQAHDVGDLMQAQNLTVAAVKPDLADVPRAMVVTRQAWLS